MGVATAKIPANHHHHRHFTEDGGQFQYPVGQLESFTDLVFRFIESDGWSESSNGEPSKIRTLDDDDDDEEDENGEISGSVKESRNFWEKQEQLLQASLYRTSCLETKIRKSIKEALKEIKMSINICVCGKAAVAAGNCRNCLMREVSGRLQKYNYQSAICKTKWRSSQDISSGDHTFLDVVEKCSKGEVRVIIELNFRAEFEMARASEEYKRLVGRLPEVFIGKVERIERVTKIICGAAKKCMKENKMYMGPWRKLGYMQSKWLSTCQRTTCTSINNTIH